MTKQMLIWSISTKEKHIIIIIMCLLREQMSGVCCRADRTNRRREPDLFRFSVNMCAVSAASRSLPPHRKDERNLKCGLNFDQRDRGTQMEANKFDFVNTKRCFALECVAALTSEWQLPFSCLAVTSACGNHWWNYTWQLRLLNSLSPTSGFHALCSKLNLNQLPPLKHLEREEKKNAVYFCHRSNGGRAFESRCLLFLLIDAERLVSLKV